MKAIRSQSGWDEIVEEAQAVELDDLETRAADDRSELAPASRLGGTGSCPTTCSSVSWTVAALKGGRPVRHS